MTSEAAARAVAEARALMRSKRANLCRHGVETCHDCERETKPTPPPDPRAEAARAAMSTADVADEHEED